VIFALKCARAERFMIMIPQLGFFDILVFFYFLFWGNLKIVFSVNS
jgi:hypothetical protein